MKRVVFINLHQNEFYVRHLSKMLFKQSSALKHRYFLDYLLCNPEIEVCNYISKYGTVLFNSVPKFVVWFQSLFRFLIYKLVIRKNGLSSKNITVIRHIKDIKSDDIVIGYRHVGCCLADMEMMHSFKIICMLHFNGETSDSNSIKKANPDILLNECDLRKYSDIFNKYYSWYKGDFIVHPFVASPRFQRTKPFFERENRCFSTGTITYKLHKEFLEVYKDSCDQPTRRQILANAKALEPWVACYNSDYLEDVEMKEYLPMDGKFTHYRKVWYNLTHAGRQKKYFSFNMVEKFNDFKMCLVGEEILGVPGIGFVEGMACGCAYIGQTVGYYEDYGMKEGVHYIGYDGSLDDLKKKISYYQQEEHQYELDRIATNGYVFAQKHFSSEKAANALLDSILQAQKKWLIKKIRMSFMETDLFQDRQFEHVVSLGHACAVAGTLERMGYREHSGPFDWNAARLLKTRIDCINDNFKLFFDSLKPDCLVQRQVPSCYYLEPCEFFMVHDFNEWAPVEDQIERVKLQYRRRVNVFLKDIKEPTLFIYYLYEGEDAKYINENMDFIVASLKKHNILNEIIFIADNKYQINYPCFYVQNPPNVDIADDFAVQNIELFRLLNNIPYPENKKKRNLEFVRKNRKFKIFRKVKKKIKRAMSIKLYGIYHHSRTWFD